MTMPYFALILEITPLTSSKCNLIKIIVYWLNKCCSMTKTILFLVPGYQPNASRWHLFILSGTVIYYTVVVPLLIINSYFISTNSINMKSENVYETPSHPVDRKDIEKIEKRVFFLCIVLAITVIIALLSTGIALYAAIQGPDNSTSDTISVTTFKPGDSEPSCTQVTCGNQG